MKRVILLLVLSLGTWCSAAEIIDPSLVAGIVVKLSPVRGEEMSNFPMLLGESTEPSVTLLLNDGSELAVPPEEITITSHNTNFVQVGPGIQLTAIGYGVTTVSLQCWYWSQDRLISIVPPPPRLVHRWSFGTDSEVGSVVDTVGNAHGWFTNNTPGGSLPLIADGQAAFDGQGGYIALPAGIASGFTSLSIALWVATNNGEGTRLHPAIPARLLDFASVSNTTPIRAGGLAFDINPIALRGMWGGMTQEVQTAWWPFPGNYATGFVAGVVAPSPWAFLGMLGNPQTPKGVTNLPALSLLADTDNRIGGSLAPGLSFNGSLDEVRMYEGILSPYDLNLMQSSGPDATPTPMGDLRRVHVTFAPAVLELSNSEPAIVQVTGDFTGATNVDLLALGQVRLGVAAGSQTTLTLQGSDQLYAIGFPGTAVLNISSLVTRTVIAAVKVPVAGPRQLRLGLPKTSFSVREPPVSFNVLGDFLYATNLDLTAHPLTSMSISDTSVVHLLPGPKLEFLKAGIASLVASFRGVPDVTTAAQITVTNPPGFAATYPRLLYRWNFEAPSNAFYTLDSVRGQVLAASQICVLHSYHYDPYGPTPTFTGTFGSLNSYSAFFSTTAGMLRPENCTIEMWVRCNATQPNQRLFNTFQATDPYSLSPGHGEPQTLVGNISLAPASSTGSGGVLALFAPAGLDSTQTYTLQAPTALPSGSWSHVVWVHSPQLGIAELYINGAQVASAQTAVGFWPPEINCRTWLGRTAGDPDHCLYGDYDEFRIYEGALTPAQVRMSCQSGPDAPLSCQLALGTPLVPPRPGSDANHMKVTVPNAGSGVLLETSPSLGADATWTMVDAPVQVETNGTSTLEIPLGRNAFFRLRLVQ